MACRRTAGGRVTCSVTCSSMGPSRGLGLLILGVVVFGRGLQTAQQACGQRGPGPPRPQEGDTVPGEWPWLTSVRQQGVHICSGSLVADTWVLTAAHCFEKAAATELDSWSVVLGSLEHEGLSPGAEEVGVTALQLPRAYNHYSQGSDLALLQLAHPVAHTPLCLPQPVHRFPFGTSCWATGWDQSTDACGSLRGEGPRAGAPSQWPWDARLKHQGKLVCGGALVSEEVVLTAAHCFIGRQTPEEWSIGLGAGPEERGLKQLTLHGAYTHPEGGNDVALLLLAQPVTLGPDLRPLCLPYADHHLPDGEHGWVLGLARQGAGLSFPQTVPVILLGPRACNQLHAAPGNEGIPILPEMVCSSAMDEPPHCEGLSGAPLVHEVRGTWFLAGLHSFGDPCRGPSRPAVFTALPAHEAWVSGLDWQVYFAKEPEPEPEPEAEAGSCPANMSNIPAAADLASPWCWNLAGGPGPGSQQGPVTGQSMETKAGGGRFSKDRDTTNTLLSSRLGKAARPGSSWQGEGREEMGTPKLLLSESWRSTPTPPMV
ncbi:serine protease 53 isoform X3 [Choloepus didactylus]|uniref:serine protease 53 isoform X3 n=1 Tax=Choloepus didactylus TaxID=27675 RepID=UPI0018A0FDF5|nr:serine protease 53 isoform X3 [Choloepus didactylus]